MNFTVPINKRKITIKFLIVISFIIIPTSVTAQKKHITIEEKNITLKKAFELIEQQTDYSIAYGQSKINLEKKISLSLKNVCLGKALHEILKETDHIYKINGYHIILIPEEETKKKNTKKAALSKQVISGRVVDVETKKPVEYINVILLNDSSKGATTDSLGYFAISNVTKGAYDLKISLLGYKPTIFYNMSGKDLLLEISLKEHSHHLNEVIITGESKAENLIQSPQMGKLSLSQTEIKNIPVIFGEADVIKALQTQPGVAAGTEGLAGMYVRGGNGDDNLYMMDGHPLYQINHLGGLFSAFNTEAIKEVNFFKSAFPARYGGRLSSVVNVVSKDGDLKEYHGAAMIGLTSGSFNIGGPIIKNKTSFNASVRRSWLDVISIPALAIINKKKEADGEKTVARYAFTDLNLKLKHHFNNRSEAYINFYFGQDILRFGKEEFYKIENEYYQKEDINKLKWGNILVASGWKYRYNNKLSSDITASYVNYSSDLRRNIYDISGQQGTDSYENISIENLTRNGINDFSLKADFNYVPTSAHTILFGANFTHHRFRPEYVKSISNVENFISDNVNSNQALPANEFSIYIEDEWKIIPALSANMGIRMGLFDVQEKSFLSVDPRFSTRLLLSPHLSLKASYSRMNQYMQQVSESYISLPTDFWVPVTKRQKPLTSDQISAGIYYNYNNAYSFSIEGYYKWMDNLLDYKDGYTFLPNGINWEDKLTSGRGWSYGTELIITKEKGKLTGHIGYGLMWSDRKFKEINEGKKFPSRYDNRHKLNIVANWKVNKKIELNASWIYMTGNRFTLSLENYLEAQYSGLPPELIPTDISSISGVDYYEQKNNFRLPSYHRLDMGINIYQPKKKGRMGIWNVSVYNTYCRMNPISVSKEIDYIFPIIMDGSANPRNLPADKSFKTFSIFPIIPSVSYTYKF